MPDLLISAAVSTVLENGFDSVLMRICGISDKAKLQKEIAKQLKQQLDPELVNTDSDSEIDYEGLCKFIKSESGTKLLHESILSMNYDYGITCKESLIAQCINHAHATKQQAKNKVRRIICAILGIAQDFFWNKLEPAHQAELSIIAHDIIEHEKTDTQSIINAIKQFTALLPELMKRPVDLTTDEDFENFEGIHRRVYQNPYEADIEDSCFTWEALEKYRHIILLAEAGAGKSETMQDVYIEAKRNHLIPIYKRLKKYPRILGLQRLFESQQQISSDYVLILDGLDEISSDQQADFFKAMDDSKQKLANKRIIITSRPNAYRYQGLSTGRLDGFITMFFVPLSQTDQQTYAQIKQVDYEAFVKEVTAKKAFELCKNFFYFSNLIEIWKIDKAIPAPADIFAKITDIRFSNDMEREYENTLEDHQYKIFLGLENAAFVMQCMQKYQMERLDYQALINEDNIRDLIPRTGFWIKNRDLQWEFSHNIFQEYFAARKLAGRSFEQVRNIVAMQKNQLRPSWMNTYSILCQMRPKGEEERWAVRYDLDAVLKFEGNNDTQAVRNEVFKRIMEQYEREETWIEWYPETTRKLAAFANSKDSLIYILGKLTNTIADRHMLNVMRVLQAFSNLYDLNEQVESALLSIAGTLQMHEAVRSEAIRTIIALKFFESKVLGSLVLYYIDSDELNVLASVYRYILAADQSASYVQFFLRGLDKFGRSEITDISALSDIRQGLKNANTIEDLQLIFEYIGSNPSVYRIYQVEEVIKVCCRTAISLYSSSAEKIITALVSILKQKWHDSEIVSIVRGFMQETQTENVFVSEAMRLPDDSYHYVIPEVLMCQSLAEYLTNQYSLDVKESIDILSWYSNRMREDEPWYGLIDSTIYSRTKQHIPQNAAMRYQNELVERNQRYFDALFDKQQYKQLILELVARIGRDIDLKGLYDIITESDYWQYADLQNCADALMHEFGFDSVILLSECASKLAWKRFSIKNIKEMLDRNKDLLQISSQQQEHIKKACLKALNAIDLEHSAIITEHGGSSINEFTVIVLQIMEQQNIECTKDQFLSMLMIPPAFFRETARATIPQYIIDHLDQPLLSEQVLKNVKDKGLHGALAISHLLYCFEKKIEDAIPYAESYLLSKDARDSSKWELLKALYDNYGARTVLTLTRDPSISDELLQAVASVIPIDEFSSELDQKIQEAHNRTKDEKWYRLMMGRGMRSALEKYYSQAKKRNGIPDYI